MIPSICKKKILIAPLDWGLGHSTRCVPIIEALSEKNRIVLGVTPLNRFYYESLFPEMEKVDLPSYNIRYSVFLPVWLKILLQWPSINSTIQNEERRLATLIETHQLDLVISDNRFGMYNPKIHCVYMSHQFNIISPFRHLANWINNRYVRRYNEIWIPDYSDNNKKLSGELSDIKYDKIPLLFIGPLSALQKKNSESDLPKINWLILLSGTEPQRTILEIRLLQVMKNCKEKVVLVRGTNADLPSKKTNIEVINFSSGEKLQDLIVRADTVISRSGYSSLMDLHLLNKKKLILIPTPGQPEQIYLAKHWAKKFGAVTIQQRSISLKTFIRKYQNSFTP